MGHRPPDSIGTRLGGLSDRSTAVLKSVKTPNCEPANVRWGPAAQNRRQLSIPELHRRSLFGVIAVPIVQARDVLLLRVIYRSSPRIGTLSSEMVGASYGGITMSIPWNSPFQHPVREHNRSSRELRLDSDVTEANAPRVRLQTNPAEISTIRYRPPTNGIAVRGRGRHLAVEHNSVNVAGGSLRHFD